MTLFGGIDFGREAFNRCDSSFDPNTFRFEEHGSGWLLPRPKSWHGGSGAVLDELGHAEPSVASRLRNP